MLLLCLADFVILILSSIEDYTSFDDEYPNLYNQITLAIVICFLIDIALRIFSLKFYLFIKVTYFKKIIMNLLKIKNCN